MASSPDTVLANLLATSNTRRCHTSFFRQIQLKSLHDALRTKVDEIKRAIKQDTGVSDAEATTEVAFALNIVKDHYTSINPENEVEAEYRTAKGKDSEDRTVPHGVVYIEPKLGHTPFFNVISVVSAAVAAGNCVAIKLDNSLLATPILIRELLSESLQPDTVALLSASPNPNLLSSTTQVYQDGLDKSPPTYNQLVSSTGKVIAIIDRNVDLSTAASSLVHARFAFNGTSPYAPDLILVNEFLEKPFLEQVLKHSVRYFSAANGSPTNGSANHHSRKPPTSKTASTLAALEDSKHWNLSVLTRGDNGAILKLTSTSRYHVPLPAKISEPVLCVAPVTSLDHAIDLIGNDLADGERLLAAFHFAPPAHAKYLSQFIPADVSFANHVPVSLLLGPAAPLLRPFDLQKRFIKAHFEKGEPVFVDGVAGSVVELGEAKAKAKVDQLLKQSATEIKEKKRAEWVERGFFEQGVLIGLGLYGIPILACVGASLVYGVRFGLRRWALL